MSITTRELMLRMLQGTLDDQGFNFALDDKDMVYGIPTPVFGQEGNTFVIAQLINQPQPVRAFEVTYDRLDLASLIVGLRSLGTVDALPATIHQALPVIAQYLRLELSALDVEDGPIVFDEDTAVINLVAKPFSLAVTGELELTVRIRA